MRNKLTKLAQGIQQSKIRAITKKIEAVGGINLGQGTCRLATHPEVLEAAQRAIRDGHNSYTIYSGVLPLREALVEKYANHNQMKIQIENVLVTSGATGGFDSVCKCFLDPGDEVIMFEPIYQYHLKLVSQRGAVPRYVSLRPPHWNFDINDLEAAITGKTKFLILCNPNNPCGKVFTKEELIAIGNLCKARGVFVVTDEVYEYIVSDGAKHVSMASLPGMFENTLTISAASKTFFVTGWRIGWLIAPESIMEPIAVRSDETYICAPAPLQHAIAHAFTLGERFFNNIGVQFQGKRECLSKALREAGLKPYDPVGAYYTLCDYTELGFKDDESAMNALIDSARIGTVPGNAFFPRRSETGLLRFCFAVPDDELERACDMLTASKRLANLPPATVTVS